MPNSNIDLDADTIRQMAIDMGWLDELTQNNDSNTPTAGRSIASAFSLRTPLQLIEQHSPLLATDDRLGVEVELEGVYDDAPEDLLAPQWEVKHDGSLRNGGREFVFAQPLWGEDVIMAFNNLETVCQSIAPDITDRCSVHVHLDVRELSPEQVLTVILLYSVLEPLFFNEVAPERADNFYCRPMMISDEYINLISNAFGEFINGRGHFENQFRMNIHNDAKYNALNIACLSNFGSLEFRHHEGTYSAEKLTEWCNIILRLKKVALSIGTIDVRVLDRMSCSRGFMCEVAEAVFDKELDDSLLTECMMRSVRTAKKLLSYNRREGYTIRPFNDTYFINDFIAQYVGDTAYVPNSRRLNMRREDSYSDTIFTEINLGE